jgi:hypothetical protein
VESGERLWTVTKIRSVKNRKHARLVLFVFHILFHFRFSFSVFEWVDGSPAAWLIYSSSSFSLNSNYSNLLLSDLKVMSIIMNTKNFFIVIIDRLNFVPCFFI